MANQWFWICQITCFINKSRSILENCQKQIKISLVLWFAKSWWDIMQDFYGVVLQSYYHIEYVHKKRNANDVWSWLSRILFVQTFLLTSIFIFLKIILICSFQVFAFVFASFLIKRNNSPIRICLLWTWYNLKQSLLWFPTNLAK